MHTNQLYNPVIESIITGAEDRIYDMTGLSIRLFIEPKYADSDLLPKLAKELTGIWDVHMNTLKLTTRLREVVTYKQIFCLLARHNRSLCLFKDIGIYLNYKDHSMAIHLLKAAKDMLHIKDSYFMAFYEPVKHLGNADTI